MDQARHQSETHPEIREEVRKLCARFPGEYWRKLDEARAYPTEFVQALTEAGYLAALIPEEYGGAGLPLSAASAILETIQAEGCNGAACHAQMYIMGTILRHGSERQKQEYLPKIATGELRLQAFGVTEPTSGTDTTSPAHLRPARRRRVRGERPEGVDQPCRALGSDAAARAHHAARSGEEEDRGTLDLHRRHAAGARARPDDPAHPRHDEPQFARGLLRQHARSRREPGRRGGARLPLHSGRDERRAAADRLGVHRRRQMVHRQGGGLRQAARRVRPADRAEPGRRVPHRAGLCADARRRADGPSGLRPVRCRPDGRGSRPTWPRCSPPRRPGPRRKRACRRMAASPSPRNTTWSASSAKRGSIRWRRSAPI